MATNPYVNFHNQKNEQDLLESLIIETIQFHGFDVNYIPRTILFENGLTEDDLKTSFDYSIPIEMYLKSYEGFDGQYEFMSKFDLGFEKRLTLSVARRRWKEEYDRVSEDPKLGTHYEFDKVRPMEGDLLYIPMIKKLMEIKMVNHEQVFFQLGSLYVYDLTCDVFDPTLEDFNTDIPEIDGIMKKFDSHFGETFSRDLIVEPEVIGQNETIEQLSKKVIVTPFPNPFERE